MEEEGGRKGGRWGGREGEREGRWEGERTFLFCQWVIGLPSKCPQQLGMEQDEALNSGINPGLPC